MTTHTITPPAAPALQAAEGKLFVVCSQCPAATLDAPGILIEGMGAMFFYRLLKREMQADGVEILPSNFDQTVTIVTLHQAFAFFMVRDVAAAARAVRPVLEMFPEFFVIGYSDEREGIWRALWPEKPAFDLHAYLPELLKSVPQHIQATRLVAQSCADRLRTKRQASALGKSQSEPPAGPTV